MDELKPCPFCGSKEVSLWYKGVRYGKIAFAECDICGAKSKAFSYYSKENEFDFDDPGAKKAYYAWNRRV